jgi:hypothetical protein
MKIFMTLAFMISILSNVAFAQTGDVQVQDVLKSLITMKTYEGKNDRTGIPCTVIFTELQRGIEVKAISEYQMITKFIPNYTPYFYLRGLFAHTEKREIGSLKTQSIFATRVVDAHSRYMAVEEIITRNRDTIKKTIECVVEL